MTDASRPAAGDERVAGLRAAVEALGGEADRRAAEIGQLRRLPTDLSAALVDTGLGRAWAPARYGGLELPVLDLLDALESLAAFEAGTAWCGMIAATTSLLGGYLPERWAEEIYGDPRVVTGGHAAPLGRARPVDGGLVVSGHWQWGSGSFHCTYLGGGTVVVDETGAPAPRADGLRAPFVLFEPGPGRAARHLVHDGPAGFGQHRLRGRRRRSSPRVVGPRSSIRSRSSTARCTGSRSSAPWPSACAPSASGWPAAPSTSWWSWPPASATP